MDVVLFMLLKGRGHRAFPVARDSVVLGRREDCDFRIPLADVSRQHCKVVLDHANGTVRVEDLGSANGTLVNGKKVQVAVLRAGDAVTLGPVTFVVQVDGVPADNAVERAARKNAPGPKLAQPMSVEDEIADVLSSSDLPDPDDSDVMIHVEPAK